MANPYDGLVAQLGAQQQFGASGPPADGAPGIEPIAPPVQPIIATPAAPAQPVNPYADAISNFHDMRVQASQASLYANRNVNPDQAAKAIDLAPQVGAPPSVVLGDMPTYQARVQAIGNTAILKSDPVLADWLAQNPVAPQVASDDLANLSMVGHLRQQLAGGFAQGVAGNQLGRDYSAGQTAANSPQVADLERSMQASGSDDTGLVHGIASTVGMILDTFAHAAPTAAAGAVAGGGIGALVTGAPTGGLAAPAGAGAGAVVGGTAGFGAGLVADGYKIFYGNMMHRTASITDAAGNPLDPTARVGVSMLAGLFGGALNGLGGGTAGAGLKAGAAELVGDAAAEAVSRPTVAGAVGNLASGLARKGASGAATGAGIGALMAATNVGAEQIARLTSSGDFDTILNDPAQRAAAVSEIADNMASMALLVGATHSLAPVGGFFGDLTRARQASSDIAGFQALEQGAAGSATRSRAPSVFQDWMGRQAGGEGSDNLYVPAQRVADLYQRMGITPDSNDGLLGPVAPDIRDQLAQGLPAGGDVVLPMSAYITHLAGSDVSRELQPDLRVRQDGMSLNDARSFEAAYAESLSRGGAEAEQQAAGLAPESRDAIRDDVFSQARQAGFANDAAQQYAALFAARYATRGERLGVDPLDLYRQEGLTIQSADQPGARPAAAPDGLDVLINALRSGRTEPSDASLLGPSLMQFLTSRGGVVDQGGELSGVGADKWHLGRPGQRRFIRPPDVDAGAALPGFEGSRATSSEFGIEGAAEAAHEAGYLPDAEPGTLVNAVRREVGGEPVRSQRNVDQRRLDFRAAADDLRDTLDRQGIDVTTATNAEIRRALSADGRGAREFDQIVYHGSPHVFDRFDSSKIGTGEGAQAFGHGLYFASNKAVAKFYRDIPPAGLSGPLNVARRLLDKPRGDGVIMDEAYVTARMRQVFPRLSDGEIKAAIEASRRMPDGRLYHVEIPDDGAYLDWDKPLADQPEGVRAALAQHGVATNSDALGRDAYRALAERLAEPSEAADEDGAPAGWGSVQPERASDPAAASQALHDAGVPGIRYLDQGSRGTAADAPSHNYVVFHDRAAAIRHYEQSAEPAARITGEEIAPRTADLKTLRAAARAFYDSKLRGTSVHSDALGAEVEFRSSRKTFNASAMADKLRLFAALPEVIEKGTLENTTAPRDPAAETNTKAYHYLTATVELDGRPVRVWVTVREDNSGHLYYNHAVVDGVAPPTASLDTALKAGPKEEGGGGTTFEQGNTSRDGINMTLGQPDGGPDQPAGGVRGTIRLSEGQQLITLFKGRDLSTLLHEAGHSWLDEMTRDAARVDAPEQIRGDMDAILHWLGVDSADAIGVAEHEQFARAAEAYLMEGRAPSEALRGPFQRFRAWLTRIYKSLAALRTPMDPAIRGIFDRLLATDDEIAGARARQGLDGMFRSAAEAGMTDAEFAAYQASIERARSEAQDGLTKRVMNDVRRQRTAEWREQEAPIREDVTREVDAQPAERALRLIRTGKLDGVDGPAKRMRLDRDAITDMHGSDTVLDLLPKAVPPVYAAEGGMHPDIMASMLGLRSGDELLQALMQHEAQRRALRTEGDGRSPRQHAIDTETYSRMVDRHGDALHDGSIEADALDHVHSERQAEVLGAELRALGRRSGQTPTPTALARAWAERTIADKRVGDGIRPGLYARAEARAGNAAMKALVAGDHAEAFRQKQAQLLNHSLYLAAKAAKADVDRGQAMFDRFGAKAEFPAIAPEYVDRIHDLLRRFEMPIKRDPAELDRALGKQTLEQWATARIADGQEIAIAPDLYDGTYARPADTLSVSQFRDLAETVRSIAHVGRDQQTVTLDGERADRADVVRQMLDSMGELPTRDVRDFANQGGASGVRGSFDRAGEAAAGFHAMLLKPEAILDRLDGDDPNGIFNRAIWRPIKAAQAAEGDLRAEMVGRMRDLRQSLGKDYGRDWDRTLPDQPELVDQRTSQPMALKKRGLIAMALNVGSESNFDRLTEGYGWTREGVQAALDRNMTAADWRYVQGIWNAFDSLFPRIEAMQRRMTDVGLEKVEPREVPTAHGPLNGGYFPVVYDPNLSQLGDRIRAAGEQRFEADYVRATTPKGPHHRPGGLCRRTALAEPGHHPLEARPGDPRSYLPRGHRERGQAAEGPAGDGPDGRHHGQAATAAARSLAAGRGERAEYRHARFGSDGLAAAPVAGQQHNGGDRLPRHHHAEARHHGAIEQHRRAGPGLDDDGRHRVLRLARSHAPQLRDDHGQVGRDAPALQRGRSRRAGRAGRPLGQVEHPGRCRAVQPLRRRGHGHALGAADLARRLPQGRSRRHGGKPTRWRSPTRRCATRTARRVRLIWRPSSAGPRRRSCSRCSTASSTTFITGRWLAFARPAAWSATCGQATMAGPGRTLPRRSPRSSSISRRRR